MKQFIVLMLIACSTLANAQESEYYKLTPTIAATALLRGDELFAELVTNLPPSDIVDSARSSALKIYGSCSRRQYVVQGLALFSGRMRAGYPVKTYDVDPVLVNVRTGTPIALLFDKECTK